MGSLSIRAALAALLVAVFAGSAMAQSCDKPTPPDKPTSALPSQDTTRDA